MPNRATVVETSPTSHVVTIPTFSFHHHHHPPPPPRAAATAAVEHPGDCPRVGQPGAGSSTPRHPDDDPNIDPNDAPRPRHDPQTASLVDATSPRRRSRRRPRRRPSIPPRHPPTTPVDNATSPRRRPKRRHVTTPPIERHHRHVATEWKQQEVGTVGKDGWGGEREGRGERTTTSKLSSSPGSFVDTRGDGGRGTTTGYVVVPRSS